MRSLRSFALRWTASVPLAALGFGFACGGAAWAQTSHRHDAAAQGDAHGSVVNRLVVPPPAAPKPPVLRPLPPPPPGVAALAWEEFFVRPVGAYGLQLTDKLKSLNGKRVRLVGYMVGRDAPQTGAFILAGRPYRIEDNEDGLSGLPANVVRVTVPGSEKTIIPFTARPLLLTGVLSVGNREEKDGSVWLARLVLDPSPKPQTTTAKSARAARKP